MEERRIVFLDIDGPLNHTNWYISEEYSKLTQEDELDIDPKCVERVNRICQETGAQIVISSDWRISSGWQSRLERVGLNHIIDCTPVTIFDYLHGGHKHTRGDEIQMWLEYHPEVINYCIIDDRQDFLKEQLVHFVHVDPCVGITDEDVVLALNILKR